MTNDDELLKEAWKLIVDTRQDPLPSEYELSQTSPFTNSFPLQKIQKLPYKFIYINGKAFSKLLVVIIMISILASSITAYAVVRIFQKHVNTKNTDVSIEDQNINSKIQKIEERYLPSQLPVNFKEVESNYTDNSTSIYYSDGYYNLYFRQDLSSSVGSFDNEDTIENVVIINGIEAIYIEKHEEKSLIFSNNGYIFYLDTDSKDISKNQLVEIAQSVQKE